MGIDYYVCSECGEAFSDCGDYKWCDCGEVFCDRCSSSVDDVLDEDGEETGETTCCFCAGDAVTNDQILEYIFSNNIADKQDIVDNILKLRKE